MVRSRYAPSPTGFMHMGNLRTALYEFLIAKNQGGTFILRIEDTDQERYVEGAADAIFETLRLTGISFDEGPGVGGGYGPYIQSQRKENYMPQAKKLIETGHAYHCFCTKERLDTLADERGIKKYDRHCAKLTLSQIEERLKSGVPYVVRQFIPDGNTSFNDEVYGTITFDNKELEDQILIKSDGMPTYNFANVIDDHDMAITHVVRGSEYLTSTPKFKLLYEALGWQMPTLVHLPLLQNESGQKISKRHGDESIPNFIEEGYMPEAIINYAALLGWSPANNTEIFTLDELIKCFDARHISKSPSTFDAAKLKWINSEHIKAMDNDKYFELALPYLQAAVKSPGTNYNTLANMTKSRVSLIKECGEMVDFIDSLRDYDIELFTHKKMKTTPDVALLALKAALVALGNVVEWEHDVLGQALAQAAESAELSKGQVLWPVRTALSGKASTPCGAIEICELLGKSEVISRLEAGIKKL